MHLVRIRLEKEFSLLPSIFAVPTDVCFLCGFHSIQRQISNFTTAWTKYLFSRAFVEVKNETSLSSSLPWRFPFVPLGQSDVDCKTASTADSLLTVHMIMSVQLQIVWKYYQLPGCRWEVRFRFFVGFQVYLLFLFSFSIFNFFPFNLLNSLMLIVKVKLRMNEEVCIHCNCWRCFFLLLFFPPLVSFSCVAARDDTFFTVLHLVIFSFWHN